MNLFQVVTLKNQGYTCLVIATSYRNPFNELRDLEKALSNLNCAGKVVFDLFAINGRNSNRFLEATFDGARLNHNSIRILNNLDEEIKSITASFFANNNLLTSTVLPESLKYLAKRGQI